MLKGISPVISPELLKTLMEMGHGDEIVIGDINFPAVSCAARLVRSDGNGAPELLDAILGLFPLDYAVECPATLMASANGSVAPAIWQQYLHIIQLHEPGFRQFEYIERASFYERAKRAYAVVASGEKARFANIILKKGIVTFE